MARDAVDEKMYAVIQHGSHQYRVSTGDRLLVDRLKADVGATVKLEEVLLLGDSGDSPKTGGGELARAVVTATVVAHRKGRKLRVMTFKPKKRHRRTLGYRSQLTELLIEDIQADGSKPVAARQAAPAKPAAKKVPAKAEAALEPEKPAAKARASTATKSASKAAPKKAPAKASKKDGA